MTESEHARSADAERRRRVREWAGCIGVPTVIAVLYGAGVLVNEMSCATKPASELDRYTQQESRGTPGPFGLYRGDRVQISMTNGDRFDGTVSSISRTRISLEVKGRAVTLAVQAISSVARR